VVYPTEDVTYPSTNWTVMINFVDQINDVNHYTTPLTDCGTGNQNQNKQKTRTTQQSMPHKRGLVNLYNIQPGNVLVYSYSPVADTGTNWPE